MEASILFRTLMYQKKPTIALITIPIGDDKPAKLLDQMLYDLELPLRIAIGLLF